MAAPALRPLRSGSSATLSPEFQAEHREALRRGTLYCCLIAAGFSAAYFGIDYLIFPARMKFLASVRLSYAAFALLMFAAMLRYRGIGRAIGPSFNLIMVTAVMISALIYRTGGAASPYYVGYNLTIFMVAVLLPWPVWLLGFSSVAMALMYVAVVVGLAEAPIDPAILLNNLDFIAISAIAGLVALELRHKLIISDFASRRELTETASRQLRFFTLLSHELRSPVTAISGATRLLRDAGPVPANESLTEGLQFNSDRLLLLINGFLDFARLESGALTPTASAVDAILLSRELVSAMMPLALARNLSISASGGSLPVMVDAQLLRQLLTNLLSNAIKFTHQGGISMSVRSLTGEQMEQALSEYWPLQARPAVEPPDGWLCFEVTDSGIGIDPGDLELLNSDFSQLNSPAAGYGGSGLGLAISRRIASLLTGLLAVRSMPGKGSTFLVLIPWTKPAASGTLVHSAADRSANALSDSSLAAERYPASRLH